MFSEGLHWQQNWQSFMAKVSEWQNWLEFHYFKLHAYASVVSCILCNTWYGASKCSLLLIQMQLRSCIQAKQIHGQLLHICRTISSQAEFHNCSTTHVFGKYINKSIGWSHSQPWPKETLEKGSQYFRFLILLLLHIFINHHILVCH